MKIVEARHVPVYEVRCSECKSVIRYKACEVSLSHITCPVCGAPIWANTISPVDYEPFYEPLEEVNRDE